MTDPKKPTVDNYISDYTLNQDRYAEDGIFNKSMFYPSLCGEFNMDSLKADIARYKILYPLEWKTKLRSWYKHLEERYTPQYHYMTVEYRINRDMTYNIPFKSEIDEDYQSFSLRILTSLIGGRKKVNKNQYEDLVKGMEDKKIKIKGEIATLYEIFRDMENEETTQ